MAILFSLVLEDTLLVLEGVELEPCVSPVWVLGIYIVSLSITLNLL